ncbi:unnamed protein product [Symbiodinium sp. CCMP2592]|nr:unnamed protein product [Symbiodinium sp. CCMP2592]
MAWPSSAWGSSWSGWDWSRYGQAAATWGGSGGGSGSPAPAPPATSGGKGGHSGTAATPAATAPSGSGGRTGGPAAVPLPAEWEQVIDAASGRAYYWNSSTGHTSWVPPQGTAAAAAPAKKKKRGKDENRRKKGNMSSVARERVTKKFVDKLAAKDVAIGNLQALQASAVVMGTLREQERDTAQAELAEVKKQLASAETKMAKDAMELQMLRRVGDIQMARLDVLEDAEKQQRMVHLALEEQADNKKANQALESQLGLEKASVEKLQEQLAAERVQKALAKVDSERQMWKTMEDNQKDLHIKLDVAIQDSVDLKVQNQALSTQLKDATAELALLKEELAIGCAPTSPARAHDQEDSPPMVPTELASPEQSADDEEEG